MLRSLAALLFAVLPVLAHGQCAGKDLIAALPGHAQLALEREAAAAPFPEGLLWQARRGDDRIVLFGTYHFPHHMTEAHLGALTPLIDRADAVYLEVSNADQKQLMRQVARDPSIMFITEGETLPDLLGDADWEKFSAAMRERAIPPFFAAKFKPIWAAMMLGIGPCEARHGAIEGNGIDERIGDYAAEIGTDSRSLEDFRVLLALLDDMPLQDQLNMIRLFFAWPDDADDMAYTLRHYYLQQKVALVWAYSRKVSLDYGGPTAKADFERLERELLIGRNLGWMDVLLPASDGQDLFVAVGAAHLPGEHGLLHLLETEGFEITRMPFQ